MSTQTQTETLEFIEETEIAERSLRRLADSRSCILVKDDATYKIYGAGSNFSGVALTDDEAWDVLSALPQQYTLSGRYDPVS